MYYYRRSYEINSVVTVMLFIFAVVLGVIAYYGFVKRDENPKSAFFLKLKGFLNFDTMIIEGLLKATYLILAIFVTLFSFQTIPYSFFVFLFILVFGNILLRVMYETSMVALLIWRNTSEINKKTKTCSNLEEKIEPEKESSKVEENSETKEEKSEAKEETTDSE